MGVHMPNGGDTFHYLERGAARLGGYLIYVFKDVSDLDRRDPTEALQEDAFMVRVVK